MTQQNQIDHLKTMIATTQRRLNQLKNQASKFGDNVPPHIPLEIEDLEAELAQLWEQYHTLAPGAEPDPALGGFDTRFTPFRATQDARPS